MALKMSAIRNLLRQLDDLLPMEFYNAEVNKYKLIKDLESNNLHNSEILELYLWRNGSRFNFDTWDLEFCSFGYLIPNETAIRIQKEEEFLGFKNRRLFPIICDYGGDYMLISDDHSNQFVYIYSPALFIVEPEIIFESLSTFLLSIYECYTHGAYEIVNSKLEVNMDLEDEIFRKNSPLYIKWSENK